MPGACHHEFFWPLRAADGRYYQVCRFCGVRTEYDWAAMQRVGGQPAAVASGPARPDLHLKLLPELEPAYRVFFRNLFDVLRPKPRGRTGFRTCLSGASSCSIPISPGNGLRNPWWATWSRSPSSCSCPRCGTGKNCRDAAACLKIPISRTTSRPIRFRRCAGIRPRFDTSRNSPIPRAEFRLRFCASRIDSRGPRTSPGSYSCDQSPGPEAEGAGATQSLGHACGSRHAACFDGLSRMNVPEARLRSWPHRLKSARVHRAASACRRLRASVLRPSWEWSLRDG